MITTLKGAAPGSSLRHPVPMGGYVLALAVIITSAGSLAADDTEIVRVLRAKGVEVTAAKGTVTALSVQDGSKLTDDDFGQITLLSQLQVLSLNNGVNDRRLARLAALGELERLQTNQAQVTDEGIKPLAKLKSLRTVAFFHPGKSFSGAGLAYLAGLPNLERLTVAGSLAFNDDGLVAVSRLTRLKEFRTWHAGGTNEAGGSHHYRHRRIVDCPLDFRQLYTRMILLGSISLTEEKNHVEGQTRLHSPVFCRGP